MTFGKGDRPAVLELELGNILEKPYLLPAKKPVRGFGVGYSTQAMIKKGYEYYVI